MLKNRLTLTVTSWLLVVAIASGQDKKTPAPKSVGLRGLAVIAEVLAREALKDRTYSEKTKTAERPGEVEGANMLLVAKQRAVFQIELSKESWRGDVKVALDIPYRVYYQVDLNEIRAGDVRWDAKNRRLYLRMPKATVGVIETLLPDPDVKKQVTYNAARFKVLDSEIEEVLTESARKDGIGYARQWGERQLPAIQKDFAEEAVRKNISRVLKAIVPDAELYFE